MPVILAVALCIVASALTAFGCIWWYRMVLAEVAQIFEEREQKFIDNVMTARERELHDAKRTHMPREDAGPPARVHSAIPLRRIGRR